jgi:serine/threonine protein kinase
VISECRSGSWPEATTTFHTQVSTPVYSAPEVLGLDSNSETSNYTNSVDIWSLGCVIYELLVGTKLFVSEIQLCRYFYGTWLFPEESLRALSPPTNDTGISLLRAMLAIQTRDRPTATDALRNEWLTGFKSENEESGDDKNDKTQIRDGSTLGRKRKNRLATNSEPKKRNERESIIPEGAKCIPGGANFWADTGSEMGDLTIVENSFDTSMVTLSDTAPTESLVVQTGSRKPDIVSHNFQATPSKSRKRMRRKQIGNTPQTCHQGRTLNTTHNLKKPVTNEN